MRHACKISPCSGVKVDEHAFAWMCAKPGARTAYYMFVGDSWVVNVHGAHASHVEVVRVSERRNDRVGWRKFKSYQLHMCVHHMQYFVRKWSEDYDAGETTQIFWLFPIHLRLLVS